MIPETRRAILSSDWAEQGHRPAPHLLNYLVEELILLVRVGKFSLTGC